MKKTTKKTKKNVVKRQYVYAAYGQVPETGEFAFSTCKVTAATRIDAIERGYLRTRKNFLVEDDTVVAI